MSKVLSLFALALLALLAVGCPAPAGSCSAATCAEGCCDSTGAYQPGTQTLACGTGGNACHTCAGSQCVSGACGQPVDAGDDAGVPGTQCQDCVSPSDCLAGLSCVQIGGTDECARQCATQRDCAADEVCVPNAASDGTQVQVCVPKNGSCEPGQGCPATCPAGSSCNVVSGDCEPDAPDAGSDDAGTSCPGYAAPGEPSCCTSCKPDGGTSCQTNGCYGGWDCDTTACRCHAPVTSCGAVDAGQPDAGPPHDAGTPDAGHFTGDAGPSGGAVSHLYFAVVGDTRPAIIDDTANYPTTVINGIYHAIATLSPEPQFVVGTGDYVFASPSGTQSEPQFQKYDAARAQYKGTFFPAMGNHECTGATATNCTSNTNNLSAFLSHFMQPLGHTTPYYAFDVNDTAGQWTAKFLVVACNAWSATQKTWLATQLGRSTTYTFVIRHEPLAVSAPCTTDMDPLLTAHPPTMMLVGHTHTYNHVGNELVEGVGGAPITGNAPYGFATIEQTATGLRVNQYNATTGSVVATFTVP
jgi:hypothetical protein